MRRKIEERKEGRKKKKFKLKKKSRGRKILSGGKFDDLPHILREIGNDYVAYHENRAYPLVISALTHSRQPRFLNANTCSTRVPFSSRRPLLLTLFSPYPPFSCLFTPSTFLRRFSTPEDTPFDEKITFKDSPLIFHALNSSPSIQSLALNRRFHRSGKIKFFSNRIRSG